MFTSPCYHPSMTFLMKTYQSSYGISMWQCILSCCKVLPKTNWVWDAFLTHLRIEPRRGSRPFHQIHWHHGKHCTINSWANSILIRRRWSWGKRLPPLYKWRVSLFMRHETDSSSYWHSVPATIFLYNYKSILLWWADAPMSVYGR